MTAVVRRCFLIGAGASCAIGLTSSLQIPLDNTFFGLLALRDSVLYSNIDRMLKAQFNGIPDLKELSLETVEDRVAESDPVYKKQLDSQLKTAVFRLLGDNISVSNDRVLPDLRAGRTTSSFTQLGLPNLQMYHLLLQNMSEDDCFVCLNYDILLDLAILSSGRSINYGDHMQSLIGNDHWPGDQPNPVKLYKPHGSLNWNEAGSPNSYVLAPLNIRIATRISVLNDPFLLGLWKQAEKRLVDVDQLVIIGCSLSPQDKNLSEFLQRWKEMSQTKETMTKAIFANNARTKDYENRLLPGYRGTVKTYPNGFDERSIPFIFEENYVPTVL